MDEPKQLTLKDIASTKPDQLDIIEIWVMNRTANVKNRSGNIALNIRSDGEDVGLNVPSTWIPICLTNEVSGSAILRSPNFRRAVNEGLITIHDPESCQEFMTQPDAIAEADRLKNMFKDEERKIQQTVAVTNAREFSSESEIDIDTGNSKNPADARIETIAAAQAAGDENSVGVLLMVVQVLSDNSIKDVDRMNYFRTNSSRLKVKDLQYIVKKSQSQSIQAWASDLLKTRKANKNQTQRV